MLCRDFFKILCRRGIFLIFFCEIVGTIPFLFLNLPLPKKEKPGNDPGFFLAVKDDDVLETECVLIEETHLIPA